MHVNKITSPVSLLLGLMFCAYAMQGEASGETKKAHPPWVNDETLLFKLLGTDALSILGGIPPEEANWALWKDNVKRLPFSREIRKIFLNGHYVCADEMEYFCRFENVEVVYVGSSIEGVTISPDSLRALSGLAKLKEINISIHGLTDAHLSVLGDLPNLNILHIEFPSKNMLSDPVQFSDWHPAELSDLSLKRISKLTNLKAFSFSPPGADDGRVVFSSQGLLGLLEAPKLESLQIQYDGLSDSFLKSVASLTKLKYVNLNSNDLSDAGLEGVNGITIEELRIQSNQFTDKALRVLEGFSLVDSLAIESPLFSYAGAIRLLTARSFGDTTVVLEECVIKSYSR